MNKSIANFDSLLGEFLLRYRVFKNWWLFIPPLNKFFSKNVIARLRCNILVKIGDTHSFDYAVIIQIAPEGLDSYGLDHIKTASIVVDAGANIGIFSLIVARRFPKSKIYAIEADKRNYDLLCENIKLNGFTNIFPTHAAIAKASGEALFYKSHHHGGHSLYSEMTKNDESVTVNTIPLSQFEPYDVLKFDAEGAEYQVFPPIPKCSIVALEIHDIKGESRDSLIKEFEKSYYITYRESRAMLCLPK